MGNSAAVSQLKESSIQSMEVNLQEIANLVESANAVKHHLESWEKSFEEKLTTTEQILDKQLQQVQTTITQFNKMLQTATNQDWQQAVSLINSESKQQTALVENVSNEFKKTTKEIQARAERATNQITKNLNHTMQGLHAGELQQLVEDSSAEVKSFAAETTSKIEQIVKWFHWKNLGLVFLLSLVVTLLVSLYIDDEWPWETHETVVKQRLAGQAVLSAWPQLTQLDRQQIIDDLA